MGWGNPREFLPAPFFMGTNAMLGDLATDPTMMLLWA